MFQGGAFAALIAPFEPSGPEVADHLVPDRFRLADHDRFGVLFDLFGKQGRMEAAHDDGDVALSVFAGDLVRPFRRIGLHRNCYRVGRFVEGDLLHPVVVEADRHVSGRQARDRRGGQRFHLPRTDVTLVPDMADGGVDDRQVQGAHRGCVRISVSNPAKGLGMLLLIGQSQV